MITKLDTGNLILTPRGKKQLLWFDITYTDLPAGINRFRGSTRTRDIAIALAYAKKQIAIEYEKRLSGIKTNQTLSPERYILTKHISQLQEETGVALDNKPNVIRSETKTRSDTKLLKRYFINFVRRKRWEELETSKSGRELVTYLRGQGIKDQTIRNYLGVYNRFLRYAEIDGYIRNFPKYPAISKGEKKHDMYIDGYAVATDQMIYDLLDTSENLIKNTTHKGRKRAYKLLYSWIRIIMDTGIRPYTNPPWVWQDIKQVAPNKVYLFRNEKQKSYKAQGGALTIKALQDLKELYFAEGTNVDADKTVPIFHHKIDKTQITKMHATFRKLIKRVGWYGMVDEIGRDYRAYSIRKWHINKSIQCGENVHQIALRVGHSYSTLERYYLNKLVDQTDKADIFENRYEKANRS